MVESNKNKSLLLGLAAGTALVGAAVLYYFMQGDNDSTDTAVTAGPMTITQELEAAGLMEIQRHGEMLDPKYLLKLLNFVTVSGRKRRETERSAALEERLRLYKAKKDDEYKQLVKSEFEKDDQMCQVVMEDLTKALDLDQQEFS